MNKSDLDLNQVKNKVQKFCEDRNWDQYHGAKDLAIGLVTESSELLELFRFMDSEQVKSVLKNDREKVSDELADVFFFLLRFSQLHDFDLLQCLENKIEKNAKKYPVEKSKNSNLKYDKL